MISAAETEVLVTESHSYTHWDHLSHSPEYTARNNTSISSSSSSSSSSSLVVVVVVVGVVNFPEI